MPATASEAPCVYRDEKKPPVAPINRRQKKKKNKNKKNKAEPEPELKPGPKPEPKLDQNVEFNKILECLVRNKIAIKTLSFGIYDKGSDWDDACTVDRLPFISEDTAIPSELPNLIRGCKSLKSISILGMADRPDTDFSDICQAVKENSSLVSIEIAGFALHKTFNNEADPHRYMLQRLLRDRATP